MPVVTALCHWLYAMHLGSNYLEGPPREVVNDERLVDIYLGDGEVVGGANKG
jgi:ABC-type branched-subunit amino acid transport system ATPase component